jgi:YD repeat-containing protein
VDSLAGTIARVYDQWDNLTDEQTSQGAVSYTYDADSLLSMISVHGQSPVSYNWDAATRLTGITQGSSSVAVSYDNANRQTQLTLPNGVVAAYTYEANGRVTGITWTGPHGSIGDLQYAYDANSRVVTKSGSLAETGLPGAVRANTFNAANEMLAFNGQSLTYDANGNLTSDGVNTYGCPQPVGWHVRQRKCQLRLRFVRASSEKNRRWNHHPVPLRRP